MTTYLKFYASANRFTAMKQTPKINFDGYGFAHIEENNKKYLLHKSGDKYLVANHISDINSAIEAVDLILNPTDEIPLNLFTNTQLKVLRIRGKYWQNLPRELPPQIGQLVNLHYLEVALASKQLPTEVGLLNNLKHIKIKGGLTELPNSLGTLPNLEVLHLDTPLLKRLPSFKKLTQLKELEISVESLSQEYITRLLKEISLLTKLEKLLVEDDEHITDLPTTFSNLKKLTHLEFTYCNFKKIPTVIFDLTNLINLDFTHCHGIKVIPPDIKRLVKLEELAMRECRVYVIPPAIGSLSNLNHLNIGDETSSQPLELLPREIGQLKKLKAFFTASPITALPKEILDCESLESCRFGIKGKGKYTATGALDIAKRIVKGNVIPLV